MSRVVISEFMDQAAVDRLSAVASTSYQPDLVDRRDDLIAAIATAEILIVRNRTKVDATLLDKAGQLQAVGRLGVGLDNIDLDACKARGIKVWPATGANDLAVAEYVITSILMLLRGAYLASASVAAGDWPRQGLIGREMSGQVIGLLGFGAIARQVARRARDMGMTIIAHDPYLSEADPAWRESQAVSLEELLSRSDALSLHVPLTQQTRHMIDAAALAKMKPSAVLVNAARGGVVDEQALASALKEGRLAGAALDVFENEPLSAPDGAIFAGVSNLILTPHIAGVTKESNIRVSNLIADKVLEHMKEKV